MSRPPVPAQHESTSLLLPREVEADKQDISMPAVGQRTEGLEPPGFLDRTLRFQIEREVAGATNELDVTDRAVAMRLIARGRRRRSRDRVLRTLCRGSRSGLFLGWALERFGRLPRLHVGGWRGDQMDAIGRRKTRVARGCDEQQHDH